jgi:hypothetical protein
LHTIDRSSTKSSANDGDNISKEHGHPSSIPIRQWSDEKNSQHISNSVTGAQNIEKGSSRSMELCPLISKCTILEENGLSNLSAILVTAVLG